MDTQTELDELLTVNPPGTPGYLDPTVQKRVSELHGQLAGNTSAASENATPPAPAATPTAPARPQPIVPPVRALLSGDADGYTAPDGELFDDAPGDDRVENAIRARFESYRRGEDLNWLLEGTAKGARRQSGGQPNEQPQAEVPLVPTGIQTLSEAVGPRALVTGATEAMESVLKLGDWLEETWPRGGPFASAEELKTQKRGKFQIMDPPKTTGGQVAAKIYQFLLPFGTAPYGTR